MTIALDPRYVHGGFEAQSTGKVAFNRVLRFGLLQRRASMSPTNATHGMAKPLHQPHADSARHCTDPSDLPSVNSGIAGASGEWFCKVYQKVKDLTGRAAGPKALNEFRVRLGRMLDSSWRGHCARATDRRSVCGRGRSGPYREA
jgi:hypothetical protein